MIAPGGMPPNAYGCEDLFEPCLAECECIQCHIRPWRSESCARGDSKPNSPSVVTQGLLDCQAAYFATKAEENGGHREDKCDDIGSDCCELAGPMRKCRDGYQPWADTACTFTTNWDCSKGSCYGCFAPGVEPPPGVVPEAEDIAGSIADLRCIDFDPVECPALVAEVAKYGMDCASDLEPIGLPGETLAETCLLSCGLCVCADALPEGVLAAVQGLGASASDCRGFLEVGQAVGADCYTDMAVLGFAGSTPAEWCCATCRAAAAEAAASDAEPTCVDVPCGETCSVAMWDDVCEEFAAGHCGPCGTAEREAIARRCACQAVRDTGPECAEFRLGDVLEPLVWCAEGCEEGWVRVEDLCYKVARHSRREVLQTHAVKQQQCEAWGANLAAVHSDAQNNALVLLDGTGRLLIGMVPRGELRWLDGSPFTYEAPWAIDAREIREGVDEDSEVLRCISIGQAAYTRQWYTGVCDELQSQAFACSKPAVGPPCAELDAELASEAFFLREVRTRLECEHQPDVCTKLCRDVGLSSCFNEDGAGPRPVNWVGGDAYSCGDHRERRSPQCFGCTDQDLGCGRFVSCPESLAVVADAEVVDAVCGCGDSPRVLLELLMSGVQLVATALFAVTPRPPSSMAAATGRYFAVALVNNGLYHGAKTVYLCVPAGAGVLFGGMFSVTVSVTALSLVTVLLLQQLVLRKVQTMGVCSAMERDFALEKLVVAIILIAELCLPVLLERFGEATWRLIAASFLLASLLATHFGVHACAWFHRAMAATLKERAEGGAVSAEMLRTVTTQFYATVAGNLFWTFCSFP